MKAPKIGSYEWADNARLQSGAEPGDPNEIGKHLELLRRQGKGELTPKDVLDDARHNNSPLHRFFQWDDSAAAEEYRLQQARGLIRAVVAVYVSEERPAQRMRAFVHIPERGAEHYRDTAQALSETKTRDMVLRQAWREFQAWRRRYNELDEFARLFEEADKLAKKLTE